MELNDLVKRAHETAVRHGFWEPAPEIGTSIALIHSELSEALEEARAGKPILYYNQGSDKPEGIGPELADATIRIGDLCGHLGINLDEMVQIKMKYNEGRPYKHGKIF